MHFVRTYFYAIITISAPKRLKPYRLILFGITRGTMFSIWILDGAIGISTVLCTCIFFSSRKVPFRDVGNLITQRSENYKRSSYENHTLSLQIIDLFGRQFPNTFEYNGCRVFFDFSFVVRFCIYCPFPQTDLCVTPAHFLSISNLPVSNACRGIVCTWSATTPTAIVYEATSTASD